MAESPRIIELQEKFEDNPRRYFASLANEYRKSGDLQRAISVCRIYLEKQPSHTAGHVVLAQALYGLGKIEEAAEAFRTVLELDPENLIALKCLGEIAQAGGNLELARSNFRQVLTADPRDHDTSGRLKAVELALKATEVESPEDWVPPRSEEFPVPIEAAPYRSDPVPEPEGPVTREDMEVDVEVDLESNVEPESAPFEAIAEPWVFPEAATDDAPHLSPEVEELPSMVAPASDSVVDEDFPDTLLPSPETDHQPVIAEPVALESAEELLAVPDLMEDADIAPAPPMEDTFDEYQYRTAEFSLPDHASIGLESSVTSTEMENEAEALLDEVDAATSLPGYDVGEMPLQARTGEYSLSRDTGEWHRESVEASGLSSLGDEDHSDEMAGVEPAGPFITETVAELYLQQGFTGEALLVYRQLARAKPDDQRIAGRIADLERRLSEEHEKRQAALETVPESVPAEVEPEPPPITPPAPLPVVVPDDQDDWFGSAPIPPVRARQSVHDFFAVLGRAKAQVKQKPERVRVNADDIRAAADVTAGFGAFGIEPDARVPKSIAEPTSPESGPQDDVRRFRAWLDGLSES